MSGTIQPTGFGGGIADTLATDSARIKQQLDGLLQQAGSGMLADTYAGLGANAAVSLSIAPQIAAQNTWQNNINAATGQMQVAQQALSQISTIASTFYANTNNLNGINASEVDSVAADARMALQQVASLLDSADGGIYVFGGQDSTNPPVPDPENILSSGFFTQIQAAVGSLGGSGAAAVIASTLAIASSNASGTSPFSAALSQPATVLQAQRPQVATGPEQQTPFTIPASANGFVTSTGSSTTGSYMRDIMRALATLGSLSSAQINDPGFVTVVADVRTSLGGAISALNEDAGVLGTIQNTLSTEQSALGETTAALQSQLANVQEADMAKTLSQLGQTQTRLQASYQLIAGLQTYSLARFLSPVTG